MPLDTYYVTALTQCMGDVDAQPEESMSIQHAIGADIIMQLDDVG